MSLPVPDFIVDYAVAGLLWFVQSSDAFEQLMIKICYSVPIVVGLCMLKLLPRFLTIFVVSVFLTIYMVTTVKEQTFIPVVDLNQYGIHDNDLLSKTNTDNNNSYLTRKIEIESEESWGTIFTNEDWFVDEKGRTLLLRGVNLAGSTKIPSIPNGATHLGKGTEWRTGKQHRNVSFIGRPFPLEEADEHLSRLRAWGLTFVRFLVTWEAIEHAGPGLYDMDYIDYVVKVVRKMKHYGISCFIDPHQDVWSRFTGGDGAPGWTLEVCKIFSPHMSNFFHVYIEAE